jgi:hypothetical protein
LFNCLEFVFCIVDVKKKEKKRKEKKQKNIGKVNVCVCICFIFYMYIFFYDRTAKIKEESNILIGSRSRIINLYVSCISNTR